MVIDGCFFNLGGGGARNAGGGRGVGDFEHSRSLAESTTHQLNNLQKIHGMQEPTLPRSSSSIYVGSKWLRRYFLVESDDLERGFGRDCSGLKRLPRSRWC